MTQLSFPSGGKQVEAILEDPQTYFAEASARAWEKAKEEVAGELADRADRRKRRNNGRLR